MPESVQPDVDLHALGGKVTKGIAALSLRTLATQAVVFGGMLALMRLLTPREFGVYAIAQSVLGVIVFFGDAGVGGALVRQKEPPSEHQLSSVFYLQLGISTALLGLVFIFAGLMMRFWPDLPADAPMLLRVLAFDFVMTSVRLPPVLLMERRLQFGRLALVDIFGSIAFYVTAVSLAFAGFGTWALGIGMLAQGALVTVVIFLISHWRPRAFFAWAAVRPLVRFGLAQQSRNVIGLINDAVTPFWGGRVLGVTAVGYLNWARTTAYFPLKMVDTLRSVGFPLFARLQDDRALLGESLGRAIHLSGFVTCGTVALCIGLGDPLTQYVFSAQWLPAVPLLAVFAAAISIGFLSPLVASALDAIGRPGVFARVALFWTVLNWIAVPIGTAYGRTLGFAIGYASHVIVGNIVIAIVLRRMLPEAKVLQRIRAPMIAAGVMVAVGRLTLLPYIHGPVSFVISAAADVLFYIALVWLLDGRALVRALSIMPKERQALPTPAPVHRDRPAPSLIP